jgi:hypothetical protein
MRGWRAACSSTPLSDAWEPDAPEVAIREVSNLGPCRIASDELPSGRLADEETLADVACDGLHQERRDAVPDSDHCAVANITRRQVWTGKSGSACKRTIG